MPVTINHNPKRSKSWQIMELLGEHGITPTIIKYLHTPVTDEKFKEIFSCYWVLYPAI
jgi:arsenate reductase (glutaredoxin)